MDSGTTDLSNFAKQLDSEEREAYVRTILVRTGPGWELFYMSALVGAQPSGWVKPTWLYERVAFVARKMPASALSKVCESSAQASLTFGDLSAIIPQAIGPANWTRQPSYIRHSRLQLTVQ
jgi:hypothetical protein